MGGLNPRGFRFFVFLALLVWSCLHENVSGSFLEAVNSLLYLWEMHWIWR